MQTGLTRRRMGIRRERCRKYGREWGNFEAVEEERPELVNCVEGAGAEYAWRW